MPANPEGRARGTWLLVGALAASLCLGACSSVSDTARSTLSSMTPYKVEVVQGNFVSNEQVQALKLGMSRQQVRDILGTSLLSDVFHKDRWDYVFTIRRQGIEAQEKRLTLIFDGESLVKITGDEMPSEQDFVARLDNHKRASGKVPQLEASDDQLKKYDPPKEKQASAQPATPEPPPLPAAYPPLEAPH